MWRSRKAFGAFDLNDPLGFGTSDVELPPKDFRFPSDGEYLQGAVEGVGAVVPDIKKSVAEGGVLTAPLASQAAMVVATFENKTGMSIDSLLGLAGDIYALAEATTPSEVALAIGDLLDGALDIAVEVATAVGAAASVVDIIPMIGAFIGAILDVIAALYEADAKKRQQQEDCKNDARGYMDQACKKLVGQSIPRPT